MLSRCCNLTTLPLPFPLSFASLDTHGNGIAESSWLTDYYNNSCRYRFCDDHDARAMLACVEDETQTETQTTSTLLAQAADLEPIP